MPGCYIFKQSLSWTCVGHCKLPLQVGRDRVEMCVTVVRFVADSPHCSHGQKQPLNQLSLKVKTVLRQPRTSVLSSLHCSHSLTLLRAACMGVLGAVKPNWHANRVMIHLLLRNIRRSGSKITQLCWAQGQSTQNCTQHKQATHTSTATRGDQALTPCLHPLPQARPCHIPTRTTQLLVCTWAAGSVTHAQINPQHKAGK